jgi:hypothetical protein
LLTAISGHIRDVNEVACGAEDKNTDSDGDSPHERERERSSKSFHITPRVKFESLSSQHQSSISSHNSGTRGACREAPRHQ